MIGSEYYYINEQRNPNLMQNGRKTNHWPRALWLGCLLAIIKLAPAVTALKMKLNKKTLGRAIRGFWVMKSTHPYYEEKECSRWISLHVCFVVVAAAILTGTFIGTLRGPCHSLAFLSLSGLPAGLQGLRLSVSMDVSCRIAISLLGRRDFKKQVVSIFICFV